MTLRVSVFALFLLVSCVVVSARLQVEEVDFDAQGLETLTSRYGQAYPGYENVGAFGQQLNYGAANIGMQQQYGNIGAFNPAVNPMQQQFGNVGAFGADPLNLDMQNPLRFGAGAPMAPQQQWSGQQWNSALPAQQQQWSGLNMANYAQPAFGNVGALGHGNVGLGSYGGVGAFGSGLGAAAGSKKGQTTVAQPIYAESMIVPKIITQPILRPHMVSQPIVQQQLIQQPIVETRQVIQPVIRRIITQPIIRPKILESTTIQPTLKTETTVQPHIIQQTVVTPQLQSQYSENAPIQEAPTTQMQQPVVQPTISSKKGGGAGLGLAGGFGAY